MQRTRNYDLLASALIDLVGAMNSPRQDEVLLKEAGVGLDRALFPLLVRVAGASALDVAVGEAAEGDRGLGATGRPGPGASGLGLLRVAELAEQVGRDHSTVSRQMGKLEALGLVERRVGGTDKRAREATITEEGRRMVEEISAARRRLLGRLLEGWSAEEVEVLGRLTRRLADGMRGGVRA